MDHHSPHLPENVQSSAASSSRNYLTYSHPTMLPSGTPDIYHEPPQQCSSRKRHLDSVTGETKCQRLMGFDFGQVLMIQISLGKLVFQCLHNFAFRCNVIICFPPAGACTKPFKCHYNHSVELKSSMGTLVQNNLNMACMMSNVIMWAWWVILFNNLAYYHLTDVNSCCFSWVILCFRVRGFWVRFSGRASYLQSTFHFINWQ